MFLAVALVLRSLQAAAAPQAQIPIRQVTTLASTDSGAIGNVYALHARPDGRVLVSDETKLRLVLFDANLKAFKAIADFTNGFGQDPGGLLPFQGDSTGFVDQISSAFVVVDASGKFGRVFTPPKPGDFGYFSGSINGVPGFDSFGRLYYRAGVPRPAGFARLTQVRDTTFSGPDSEPVVRADFDKRSVDTVTFMRVPLVRIRFRESYPNGPHEFVRIISPLPSTDDWAYLPDGTVAVVRGSDYHVDWYFPDGSHKATPKMPFDWRRLTDAEKQSRVDSVQRLLDSTSAANARKAAQEAAAQGRPAPGPSTFHIQVVTPSELPDYVPPVRAASQIRADLEGNLWIIPSTSVQAKGGTLFDVVNRNGESIERVQLPAGRNLAGFGVDGIIYMSVPSGGADWARVEKARIVR